MATPDLSAVLAMRTMGESARMADLSRLLSTAVEDDPERRAAFAARISDRTDWLGSFASGSKAFEEWQSRVDSVDQLVDEVVALVIAALLQARGIDMAPFAAGGLLLNQLTRRAGVPPVILGQTQRFESMDHIRGTVSLRFPGSRIWELPFLAHEFGHHAIAQFRHREPALVQQRPLAEVKKDVMQIRRASQPTDPYAEPHAGEQVADCVATVACGSTFPIACLCLRVPSPTSSSVSPTHPTWQERIATMRETLDVLSEITGLERYRVQRESVVDPLAIAVLGSLPSVTAAGRQAAQRTVTTIWRHRKDLVYQDADLGIDVEARLARQDATVAAGTSVTAVVDGAWRWRLARDDQHADPEREALAIDYCHQAGSSPWEKEPTSDK